MSLTSEVKTGSIFERFIPALLLVAVVLAFVVGVLWQKVSNLEKGGTNNNAAANNVVAPTDTNQKLAKEQAGKLAKASKSDHLQGSLDSEIIMIEYSDLECPFCSRFHPTAKQAFEEYKGKVAWVYRHFPLETIHQRALPAANSSECVASLGGNDAFWKFIDAVFTNQTTSLTDEALKIEAVKVGIKEADYTSCVTAKKFESKVKDMAKAGETAGVTGTPATYIVNKKGDTWLVPGALPYESLKSIIEEALK